MNSRVDVAIVGGGPVGLAMALQLGRLGVRTELVERRAGPTRHPKATGVHARTMEIFRQWGIAERIRESGGLSPEWASFVWATRVLGFELGKIDLMQDTERLMESMTQSPEFLAWCSQDVLEPVLREAASRYPSVRIGYNASLDSFLQQHDGVTLEVSDAGVRRTIKARYLVAADGANSEIRQALSIAAVPSEPFDHHINVCFRAALEPYYNARRHMMWWITNRDTVGTLIKLSGQDRWIYQIHYKPAKNHAKEFTAERCARIIAHAIGVDSMPLQIESILPWHLDHALAERFSAGRVFLIGDAAHRFPPTGGFGMNSGIGDAHNLAWKLNAVIKGVAGEGLLDTYEDERKPVALVNIRQAMINTERADAMGAALDAQRIAEIEEPSGEALRRKISEAIPGQRESYWSQGQQFGFVYRSGAVADDGTEPILSSISDYKMNAHPGARAPHLWLLAADGQRTSITDLFGDRFILLASPGGGEWAAALSAIASEWGVDARAVTIGKTGVYVEESTGWTALYGVTASGAVLIRPDGYVAARFNVAPRDTKQSLIDVFSAVLAQPVSAYDSKRHTLRVTL